MYCRVTARRLDDLSPGDDRLLYYAELCEEFIDFTLLAAREDSLGQELPPDTWLIIYSTVLRLGLGWRDVLMTVAPPVCTG